MFELYEEPSGDRVVLSRPPQPGSGERDDAPAQPALPDHLDHLEAALAPQLDAHGEDELALALEVGLPPERPLTGADGGLDDYLRPVVQRLGPQRLASAWATKRHGDSRVGVGPLQPVTPQQLTGWHFTTVAVAASSESHAWKEQIAAQLDSLAPVADAVALQLCFRVGPERSWAELWRPTIDALGAILGADDPDDPFSPRDDRVVRLGLHRNVDAGLGHAVEIGIAWRPARADSG